MYDFLIITPTIENRTDYLLRLNKSIEYNNINTKPNVKHIICADGDFLCPFATDRVQKSGAWGYPIRNLMLRKYASIARYVLFVDDDNILVPGALSILRAQFGMSKIIISQMLETPSGVVFPGSLPIRAGTIGTLNYCISSDLAIKSAFGNEYEADYQYYVDCLDHNGGHQLVLPQITSVWTREGI
jgi:hypothetical protein